MQDIQSRPIINLPSLYKDGLIITRSSNTVLSISAGICRDSNNTIDIVIGSRNVENVLSSAPISLDMAVRGLNGLDAGTIAGNTMYAIYAIADSHYYKPVGCIATLATNLVPLLPSSYDSYRLIGFWATNNTSQFLLGRYTGRNNELRFFYDTQEPVLSAGTASSATAISLAAFVPPLDDTIVGLQAVFTSPTAGLINSWYNGATPSGNNYILIYSQVASVPISEQLELVTNAVVGGIPKVSYAVAATTNVSAYVTFFQVSV